MKDLELKIFMSTSKRIDDGAEIALKNRLYVPGWEMYDHFSSSSMYFLKLIIIAYVDNNAVGSCIVVYDEKLDDKVCHVFVRRKFRMRGIGCAMYKQAKKSFGREKDFLTQKETLVQQKFWKKVQAC